ncbi:unnamed protein product [Toxocara canis]|uniref:Uncharacterized protein n=1 Tax=Toxocara canis TaxID=6265 RepID=A0A183TZ96_TOXCA|nr:unnamed protein product [Toxocara canis]
MIAHDLSDESSLHDVTPMRESALGSSKATSLDAIGSEVSIHLPNSGSLAFTATTCLQKNSMSNQFTKKRIVQRKSSNSSVHSETRTNLILQNVGRTIQRLYNKCFDQCAF